MNKPFNLSKHFKMSLKKVNTQLQKKAVMKV